MLNFGKKILELIKKFANYRIKSDLPEPKTKPKLPVRRRGRPSKKS